MGFLIRQPGSNEVNFVASGDPTHTKARMIERLQRDPLIEIYELEAVGNGDFLLKRQQITAATEVFEDRLIDCEFEDVN